MIKSVFKRQMRFVSIVLIGFVMLGLFPANAFASDQASGNDVDDVIELILDILNNEDNAEDLMELQERLEGIGAEQLQFLLEKMEVLINAEDSILPGDTKAKLLEYGINSGTVAAFLDDVFDEDNGVFAGDNFEDFIDILTSLLGKEDVSLDDLGVLLDYYHQLDEAFTDNFSDAVGAGKEKLKTYDLVALSTAFFKLFGESLDPFALTAVDKDYIEGVIDDLPGSVREKLELYGINWAAYDYAIATALEEGLITGDDISVIRSILGIAGPVLAPTASPEGGIYYNDVTVELSTLTVGAEIYYTTNGNDPIVNSDQKYSTAITVNKTTTIKAMAVKDGASSEIKTFIYTIKTGAPTASPKPGTFSKEDYQSIDVSLSSSITSGATIYYTKDGKTPTTGSTLYSGPITISDDTVIKAIAVKNGVSSQVVTFSYKFVVKVITISDDYVVDDGEANIEIPDVPLGEDGKTQPVQAVIPVSDALSEALGIPENSSLSVTLPPLNLGGGQVSVEIKKATMTPELEALGTKILAIEITVAGLEGQKVTLVLPLPEGLDADDNIGAFHYANGRWEYREATITDDGDVQFETDLSPVAIAEAVEVPEITGATPTTNSVALAWTAVQDAQYEVEVYKGDTIVATYDEIASTSYTVAGLSAKTSYTFKVRAIDTNGFESAYSEEATVTTLSSGSSGGGGGGGSSSGFTISDSEVTKQLNAGNKAITITVPAGTKTINISVRTYNKIAAAGKDLVINTDKVSFEIPDGAFAVSGTSGQITLKVGELSDTAAKDVTDKLDSNAELVGKVFDITSSPAPKEEVLVTISYDEEDLSGIDEDLLDVYWYNETTGTWVAMNGTVDQGDNTIEFSTTHFSKYAVLSYQETVTFTDIKNHWAKADIELMVSTGVVKGISATEFAPNDPITRAQFAALVVRALGLEADTGYALSFSDVGKAQWYYGEVAAAFKAGIVKGTGDTTFAPNANITREEMAVMISRAMAVAGEEIDLTDAQVQEKLAKFKDAANIASWAQADVAKAVEFGIITGRTDDTFVAKANATRAESTVMIKRMYVQIH